MLSFFWLSVSGSSTLVEKLAKGGLIDGQLVPLLSEYEDFYRNFAYRSRLDNSIRIEVLLDQIQESQIPVHLRVKSELAKISDHMDEDLPDFELPQWGLLGIYFQSPEVLASNLEDSSISFDSIILWLRYLSFDRKFQLRFVKALSKRVGKLIKSGNRTISTQQMIFLYKATQAGCLPLGEPELIVPDLARLLFDMEEAIINDKLFERHFRFAPKVREIWEQARFVGGKNTEICRRIDQFLENHWMNGLADYGTTDRRVVARQIMSDVVDDMESVKKKFLKDALRIAKNEKDGETISALFNWYAGNLYNTESINRLRHFVDETF